MNGLRGIDGFELRFWLGLIALFLVLSVVCLWLWVAVPVLLLRGHSVVVTSGSMRPVIEAGDVLVLQRYDGRPLGRGAVVTFRDPEGGLLTHRIVAVNEDGSYLTRGDANASLDSAVLHQDRILGRASVLVPLVGRPAVWVAHGRFGLVAVWLAGVVGCGWLARHAVLHRYDPWQSERHLRPSRSTGLVRRGLGFAPPARRTWSVGMWELDPRVARAGAAGWTPAAPSSAVTGGSDAPLAVPVPAAR